MRNSSRVTWEGRRMEERRVDRRGEVRRVEGRKREVKYLLCSCHVGEGALEK